MKLRVGCTNLVEPGPRPPFWTPAAHVSLRCTRIQFGEPACEFPARPVGGVCHTLWLRLGPRDLVPSALDRPRKPPWKVWQNDCLNGCGSKIGTPNGTLASGNMDQNLWSPGGSILTHTQMIVEVTWPVTGICWASFVCVQVSEAEEFDNQISRVSAVSGTRYNRGCASPRCGRGWSPRQEMSWPQSK